MSIDSKEWGLLQAELDSVLFDVIAEESSDVQVQILMRCYLASCLPQKKVVASLFPSESHYYAFGELLSPYLGLANYNPYAQLEAQRIGKDAIFSFVTKCILSHLTNKKLHFNEQALLALAQQEKIITDKQSEQNLLKPIQVFSENVSNNNNKDQIRSVTQESLEAQVQQRSSNTKLELVKLLLEQDKEDEAVELLKELEQQGNPEAFNRLLKLSPTNKSAKEYLLNLAYPFDKQPLTVVTFKEDALNNPKNALLQINYGIFLLNVQHFFEAALAFEKAAELGDPRGLAYLKSIAKQQPQFDIHYLLAQYHEVSNKSEAIGVYEEAQSFLNIDDPYEESGSDKPNMISEKNKNKVLQAVTKYLQRCVINLHLYQLTKKDIYLQNLSKDMLALSGLVPQGMWVIAIPNAIEQPHLIAAQFNSIIDVVIKIAQKLSDFINDIEKRFSGLLNEAEELKDILLNCRKLTVQFYAFSENKLTRLCYVLFKVELKSAEQMQEFVRAKLKTLDVLEKMIVESQLIDKDSAKIWLQRFDEIFDTLEETTSEFWPKMMPDILFNYLYKYTQNLVYVRKANNLWNEAIIEAVQDYHANGRHAYLQDCLIGLFEKHAESNYRVVFTLGDLQDISEFIIQALRSFLMLVHFGNEEARTKVVELCKFALSKNISFLSLHLAFRDAPNCCRYFEKIILDNFDNAEVLVELLDVLLEKKYVSDYFRKIINTNQSAVFYKLANLAFAEKRWQDVVTFAFRAVELGCEKRWQMHAMLGDVYNHLHREKPGKYSVHHVIDQYISAIKNFPMHDNVQPLFEKLFKLSLARIYEYSDVHVYFDIEKKLLDFAVEKSAQGLFVLGSFYYSFGLFEKAKEYFGSAITAGQNFAYLMRFKAHYSSYQEKQETPILIAALADFQACEAIVPKEAAEYFAVSYQKLDKESRTLICDYFFEAENLGEIFSKEYIAAFECMVDDLSQRIRCSFRELMFLKKMSEHGSARAQVKIVEQSLVHMLNSQSSLANSKDVTQVSKEPAISEENVIAYMEANLQGNYPHEKEIIAQHLEKFDFSKIKPGSWLEKLLYYTMAYCFVSPQVKGFGSSLSEKIDQTVEYFYANSIKGCEKSYFILELLAKNNIFKARQYVVKIVFSKLKDNLASDDKILLASSFLKEIINSDLDLLKEQSAEGGGESKDLKNSINSNLTVLAEVAESPLSKVLRIKIYDFLIQLWQKYSSVMSVEKANEHWSIRTRLLLSFFEDGSNISQEKQDFAFEELRKIANQFSRFSPRSINLEVRKALKQVYDIVINKLDQIYIAHPSADLKDECARLLSFEAAAFNMHRSGGANKYGDFWKLEGDPYEYGRFWHDAGQQHLLNDIASSIEFEIERYNQTSSFWIAKKSAYKENIQYFTQLNNALRLLNSGQTLYIAVDHKKNLHVCNEKPLENQRSASFFRQSSLKYTCYKGREGAHALSMALSLGPYNNYKLDYYCDLTYDPLTR